MPEKPEHPQSPAAGQPGSPRPFGLRDKLGYLLGDMANDFTFLFAGNYLMKFYTDVFGVTPAVVGILFLAARFVDAFTDVGMGRLVDTLPAAQDGRFRPWLRRMALPLFLINALMYLYPVAGLPMAARIGYMFLTYILWGSVCYTAANIPYGAMAAVVSPDPAHRTSLSAFRSLGAMFAAIPITTLSPLLLFRSEGGAQVVIPQRFLLAAVIYGGIALVCYLLCYRLTAERVRLPDKKLGGDAGFFALVKTLLHNRALLALIGAALAMLLAQLLNQSMTVYLFSDYFRSAALLSVNSLVSFLPMLALAPFASRLSARFGKKECSLVGVAVAAAAYAALFFLHLRDPYAYIALTLLASVGMGFFNMVIWAFITDIIDDWEVRTGRRDDGAIYAVYSFSRKMGQALAGGIGGFALSAIGYLSATPGQGAVQQSQATLDGIYRICTGAPALSYLAVFLLLLFAYPLGKRQVEQNTAALAKRRDAAGE